MPLLRKQYAQCTKTFVWHNRIYASRIFVLEPLELHTHTCQPSRSGRDSPDITTLTRRPARWRCNPSFVCRQTYTNTHRPSAVLLSFEISRLTRLYISNFVKLEVIQDAADNLTTLPLTDEILLDNEELGIGTDTWATLTVLQEEMPFTPFFVAVKQLYRRSTEKMLKKFPFGDSLFRDLLVLNPKVSGCKVDILVSLAKRFPQLKLDVDTLKEEFFL